MVVEGESRLTGIVLVPIMMAVGMDARLTSVPEIVIAGAPGVTVWEPMTMGPSPAVGLDWAAWVIGMVLVPITIAVGIDARLTGVPEMVIAGAPGVMVWEPMTMGPGPVVGLDWAAGVTGIVLEPITIAVGMEARLTRVPDIVTGGAPGVMV